VADWSGPRPGETTRAISSRLLGGCYPMCRRNTCICPHCVRCGGAAACKQDSCIVKARRMHMPSSRTLWGCCSMQTRQLHSVGKICTPSSQAAPLTLPTPEAPVPAAASAVACCCCCCCCCCCATSTSCARVASWRSKKGSSCREGYSGPETYRPSSQQRPCSGTRAGSRQ